MKSPDTERQASEILGYLRKSPEGLSISEILEQRPEWTRRTVLRRLTELRARGVVRSEGGSRTTRYFAITPLKEVAVEPPVLELSEAGEEVRAYVAKDLLQRTPVGYQREFLEAYLPNQTFYLNEEERQQLRGLGEQPNGEKHAGTFARKIFDRLLIDLSWNSSRLEGNTYSLLETERLLSSGIEAGGKSSLETQMILNHKTAIEFLIEGADEIELNSLVIRNLHALLSDGLLGDLGACGRARTIPVGISGTVFHPLEVPQVIEECFEEILEKVSHIRDPYEQAFFLMVHLPYLQPFEDINKRVSRLAANIPLIKENLCPLSFIEVPENQYIGGILGVYELNRIDLLKDLFLWAYHRSTLKYSAIRHSLRSPDPFRLRHRMALVEVVHEVIARKMSKSAAIDFIRQWTDKNIAKDEAGRFIEIVDTELLSLHEGNMGRMRITLLQFEEWKKIW